MAVLSVDPGDTCGLALWDENGKLLKNWKLSLEDFIIWADELDISLSTIVYESYIARPGMRYNQKGSKLKASQAIGVVKLLARRQRAKLVVQEPGILKITALHAGVKVPQVGHIDDAMSAYLHGFRHFIVNGTLKPVLQQGVSLP